MRSNHEPVTDAARLLSTFGVTLPAGLAPAQPGGAAAMAPFIVQARQPGADRLGDVDIGHFGLQPAATQATHCRVETMKSDPTCRESWWSGQRCVVPVERLTEWFYAAGRPGLWSVSRVDEAPMGLAGLWKAWAGPTGETVLSFCVLTLAANGHAIFDRLKHPMHEKRMPVILCPQSQRQWLNGTWAQAERLLQRCPAEQLHAAPLASDCGSAPPDAPDEADLFADIEWPTALPVARRKRVLAPRLRVQAPVPVTGDLFA